MKLVLIVHNVRSANNVGSLFRTADGLGVDKIYFTGYAPYPETDNDARLPHERRKITQQIHKTALGAELSVPWEYEPDILGCLDRLKADRFTIVALEQTEKARPLEKFIVPIKTALIVGNEVSGLDEVVLKRAEHHIQIPMRGHKESFNVAIAAAIALYHLQTPL
jgi:23S rRNA (guanosine2251-2'-O)-methyltransferase